MRRRAVFVFICRAFAGILVALIPAHVPAIPAFPGAEGYGANTGGGRGGTVVHVTNLNDSGPGSFRTAVSAANRTIVFDVSGTIDLQSDLKITRNNLTIAGQTAPGDGIAVKRRLLSIQNTHDVIIRFIRARAGDIGCTNFQDDSFHCVNVTNVIVDHVSSSWSIDECCSVTWSTNVSVQWCLIAESLRNSCHAKGAHGYGSLLRYGNGGVSFHHNLYADHSSRNPRPGDNIQLDFVNNVVYNWGFRAGYNADDSADNPAGFTNLLNYVGNYFKSGPSTTQNPPLAFVSDVPTAPQAQIYQAGNLMNGAATGPGMFSGPYTELPDRLAMPLVLTEAAATACERVLAFAGASAARDAVDARVVGDVRNNTGAIIDSQTQVGGWPTLNSTTLPPDNDGDGMPNYWELALGLNPNVANNNHTNADGYTDLENYLNWLAAPHALCNRNGSADLNLRRIVGATNNFGFSVAPGTNGSVSLLGDGFTARFVAAPGYSGVASFNFFATNAASGVSFGPVNVGLLVTITNAANSPPVLAAITDRTMIAGATLTFTNAAADTDQPPQTLTFSLPTAPAGATVNATNGVFLWRPPMAQSPSANTLSVVVSDNGSPSLSATQSFAVQVNRPPPPAAIVNPGAPLSLTITGEPGPDYSVQASTNLSDWTTVFTTNSPALPFPWTDPASAVLPLRFYRILLGP